MRYSDGNGRHGEAEMFSADNQASDTTDSRSARWLLRGVAVETMGAQRLAQGEVCVVASERLTARFSLRALSNWRVRTSEEVIV